MTKFIKILLCLSTLGLVAQNNFNQFDDKGERHGPWRKFFKNTNAIRYSGTFEHGKEVGEFLFYTLKSNKSVLTSSKVFDTNNNLAQVKFFASNGTVISEGKMNGRLHIGPWVYYHKNSKVIMTEEFYNNEGKLNGVRTTYYKNSKIAGEVSYDNGLKNGISKSFSQSGILINKINYRAGEMDGIAEFYNEGGQLLRKGNYLNGLKHGSWFEYENQQLVNELLYYYGSLQDNN